MQKLLHDVHRLCVVLVPEQVVALNQTKPTHIDVVEIQAQISREDTQDAQAHNGCKITAQTTGKLSLEEYSFDCVSIKTH